VDRLLYQQWWKEFLWGWVRKGEKLCGTGWDGNELCGDRQGWGWIYVPVLQWISLQFSVICMLVLVIAQNTDWNHIQDQLASGPKLTINFLQKSYTPCDWIFIYLQWHYYHRCQHGFEVGGTNSGAKCRKLF